MVLGVRVHFLDKREFEKVISATDISLELKTISWHTKKK